MGLGGFGFRSEVSGLSPAHSSLRPIIHIFLGLIMKPRTPEHPQFQETRDPKTDATKLYNSQKNHSFPLPSFIWEGSRCSGQCRSIVTILITKITERMYTKLIRAFF